MSKVAIVSDSTAYIPQEIQENLPIFTVPLHVMLDDKNLLDGVDIQPEEFYALQRKTKVVPTTSQPSPEEFKKQFAELLDAGYEILCETIAYGISGTYHSALQAKEAFPNAPIEVIDSKLTSMALGFCVVESAKLASQGATLAECTAFGNKAITQSGAVFTVSDLGYLHRGGRINSAAAFLGTALNLKPTMELRGGKIEAVGKVRTFSKAMDSLVEMLIERVPASGTLRLGYLLAQTRDEAQILHERIFQKVDPERIIQEVYVDLSPVIGCHTGPGTLGLAYMYDM